jgi:hypothetical protein
MDLQTILNWVAFLLASIIGFFARSALTEAKETAKSLVAFQIAVAKEYVTHTDLRRIEDALVRIEGYLLASKDK